MTRAIASLVLAAIMSACSAGTGPSGTAGQPTPIPSSTAAPTPSAPTPSASPRPDLEVSPVLYVAWDTGFATANATFYAIAQVVVPVKNVGPAWVRLRPSASHYTITSSDGRVLATATFDSAYPSDLAPGASGYLTTEAFLNNEKASSIGAVTGDVASERIAKADAVVVTVASVKTKLSTAYHAIVTSGTATNHSSKRIDGFDVVALYFDTGGSFLGFGSLNPGVLRAGATLAFETIPVAHGLALATIAKTAALPGCYCPNQ